MIHDTKYHKTSQYRQAVRALKDKVTFDGLDSDGNIKRRYPEENVIPYKGTVKLHGTNANIVLHGDDTITFHSKQSYLGCINYEGDFILESDNYAFAGEMSKKVKEIREVFKNVPSDLYPLKLSGEWCGPGVQKGVGISDIPEKALFLFSYKDGDGNHGTVEGFDLPTGCGIYNIYEFNTYEIGVNINNPDLATVEMSRIVESVELECPVAKALGISKSTGEGVVWSPVDGDLYSDTSLWFKTKGQKHSVSKVKKLVSVDPDKLNSITEFLDYAVTDNRLQQGLEEVGSDLKDTGKFIGWVSRDISQEESDVLGASGLSMKDVGKYIAERCRVFFLDKAGKT